MGWGRRDTVGKVEAAVMGREGNVNKMLFSQVVNMFEHVRTRGKERTHFQRAAAWPLHRSCFFSIFLQNLIIAVLARILPPFHLLYLLLLQLTCDLVLRTLNLSSSSIGVCGLCV